MGLGVVIGYLFENVLTAAVIVAYLAYEIRYGRLNTLAAKVDEVIYAVLALARVSDHVDEDQVAERLNGHTPDDLLETRSREED